MIGYVWAPQILDYLITQQLFLLCAFLTGNYYGTPRPVHIGPESPPITYQEHRNLLRNFRTRSKSLSNLEKAVEEGENSEEDSGLSGTHTAKNTTKKKSQKTCWLNPHFLLGGSSGVPPTNLPLSQSWESAGGRWEGTENGGGERGVGRGGGPLPENWELAFNDSGEPYYIEWVMVLMMADQCCICVVFTIVQVQVTNKSASQSHQVDWLR